ncbi:MAG: hypothetical protein PUJ42_03460 [Bacteroidales bacterium]|nr:hypothetical protein [Bacteroidales bacterium]
MAGLQKQAATPYGSTQPSETTRTTKAGGTMDAGRHHDGRRLAALWTQADSMMDKGWQHDGHRHGPTDRLTNLPAI